MIDRQTIVTRTSLTDIPVIIGIPSPVGHGAAFPKCKLLGINNARRLGETKE